MVAGFLLQSCFSCQTQVQQADAIWDHLPTPRMHIQFAPVTPVLAETWALKYLAWGAFFDARSFSFHTKAMQATASKANWEANVYM